MHKCKVCPTEVKSDKWNSIRAHANGWYFQKNGDAYCPEHRPSWAPKTWRKWGNKCPT